MLVETDELADESDQIRGIREINIKHELAEEWVDHKWEPEPMDAAPGKPEYLGKLDTRQAHDKLIDAQIRGSEFRAKKANDILSILVGLYEARDVIVTEIQMWLARELLAVKEYDYDEQVSQQRTRLAACAYPGSPIDGI